MEPGAPFLASFARKPALGEVEGVGALTYPPNPQARLTRVKNFAGSAVLKNQALSMLHRSPLDASLASAQNKTSSPR
jgi:hypothetical protein